MKKLLSVIAVLLLAITLVPVQSFAGARGSITPITQGSDLTDGGHNTVSLRPFPAIASGDKGEYWMALTSRFTDEGFQTVRTIYQFTNATSDPTALAFMGGALQAPFFFAVPDPWSADHVRAPLLTDPLRIDSYTDPAWSPNGRFLAYVKTDKFVSSSAIFVQEFSLDTAQPENEIIHSTKVGSPIAVTDGFLGDGHQNRHPSWSPDGNSLTFDSDRTGLSNDIYTQVVFPSVAPAVRQTSDDAHSEEDPDWSPEGNRIVFSSNLFGAFTLLLKDLVGGGVTSAETSFANVSHRRPSWSSDGNSIYYDAPQAEDADNNLAVWKLDLDTQQKCEIALDINSNFDVDVSSKLVTRTVPNFNFINFTADAQSAFGFGGQHIWRSNYVQNCLPPLPIGVDISPSSVSTCILSTGQGSDVTLGLSMSDEVIALGFSCSSFNTANGEGLRFSTSGRNPSPQINGLNLGAADLNQSTGAVQITNGQGGKSANLKINRRRMVNRLVQLGFAASGGLVPVQFNAYSRNSGRKFQGFGYVRFEPCNTAASLSLLQNSPNPFNPQTTIKFATSRDGNVSVKIFNVHGGLVRTLTNQWYPQGEHQVQWNGKSDRGTSVSSGIYYAKAFGPAGAQDQIKMVMMK